MKVLIKRTAGIDIHKKIIVVTIRLLINDEWVTKTREFQSFTKTLYNLTQWLIDEKIEIVVMESTSVYWKSLYEIIEASQIPVILVNARHVKSIPGRKTDVQDSEWLATLVSYGFLKASFIPPKNIRELRLMTRYRRKLGYMLASEKNRLQKILDDSGIRLSCVVSDIDGVSARKMIESLIVGEIEPDDIAEMALGRLKKKKDELVLSLNANLSDRHKFLLKEIQDHIKNLTEQIKTIDGQVETAMQSYREEWQLLQTIPGIDKIGAAMLLSEIGVDMTSFGSSDRLCRWAGVSPGNNESGKTPRGNVYVKSLLCEFANSAKKTKSQFKGRYEGLVIRRGHKKTIIALGHKILEIVYILLKKKVPYTEPNVNYEELIVNRNAPRWIKMLDKYGYMDRVKSVK